MKMDEIETSQAAQVTYVLDKDEYSDAPEPTAAEMQKLKDAPVFEQDSDLGLDDKK
jgi:hypothetical protein